MTATVHLAAAAALGKDDESCHTDLLAKAHLLKLYLLLRRCTMTAKRHPPARVDDEGHSLQETLLKAATLTSHKQMGAYKCVLNLLPDDVASAAQRLNSEI